MKHGLGGLHVHFAASDVRVFPAAVTSMVLILATAVGGCVTTSWPSVDGGVSDVGDSDAESTTDGATEPDSDEGTRCGDGFCTRPGESVESCPEDCAGCTLLADVTDLIETGELFYGYSSLGTSTESPGCGELGEAKEVSLSLTPGFTGDLVLSTRHPSTQIETVLEVREERCNGEALGCDTGQRGATLTIPVEAGTRYVALVETADDEAGVFALGIHRPGVCEGAGTTEDLTSALLTGRRFVADTAASTASVVGSCGPDDDGPEVRYTFTAPRAGRMIATTAHSNTTFDTVLHVREGESDGTSYCDSTETEIACAADGAPADLGALLRFDVLDGRVYDLFVDGADGGGQATLTLGYRAESPARASLQGCDHETIRDGFGFFAESGQDVFVAVDTVDAATAADTRLLVRWPDGTELHEADDDVDCTYDPPSWSCPEHSFTAGATGLYVVEVYVGSSESCYDRHLVRYELTVDVAGAGSELVIIRDQ